MEEKGRLPEGIEWPRFEDGTPVRFGDMGLDVHGRPRPVMSVKFTQAGLTFIGDDMGDTWWGNDTGTMAYLEVDHGKRVKRPPVLAADGEPLDVGQTVYHIADGREYTVEELFEDGAMVTPDGIAGGRCRAEYLTHERPVLDADGVPIHEGDTVYLLPGDWCDKFPCFGYHGGEELEVFSLHADHVEGGIGCRDTRRPKGTCLPQPSQLTHRAPVIAADGRPLRVGDTVWHVKSGSEYTVKSVSRGNVETSGGVYTQSELTHERPVADTWERLEDDAAKDPCGYFGFDEEETCGKCPASGKSCEQTMARDLMRRCRALAEQERGE